MKIRNAVALVTGANRGLGRSFVQALAEGGARKIYAGARDPSTIDLPGVVPVRLDVTRAADVADAARVLGDVSLLINNAGILRSASFLAGDGVAAVREELETNFFGPIATSRAFAPILALNGGGAIINVLSVLAWLSLEGSGTYSASKAAAWSFTNGLRIELKPQGTQVLAVHVGYMDTDMASGVTAAKVRPEDVARDTLAALEAGREELLADETSRWVKQGLVAETPVYLAPPPPGPQE